MIKRKKRNPVKTLQNKAERLWKEVCLKKYGKFCHVQRYYPHIKINHTDIIQIDHCISRANKYFFYDVNNGTPVCSGCNSAKNFKVKSVDTAISELVKRRNPKWYENAIWLDQTREGNFNFSKIWWLEEIIEDLQRNLVSLQ